MTSHITKEFRHCFERLPVEVQRRAREMYKLFLSDSQHPSLHFKKLPPFDDVWSVRITGSYRAIGRRNDDQLVWFFIGTHADYEKVLGQR